MDKRKAEVDRDDGPNMTTSHANLRPDAVVALTDPLRPVAHTRARMIPAIRQLVAKLETATASEGELDFASLVEAAQQVLKLDDGEMAQALDVSRPTITRWMRGVSSPHPLTRSATCGALIKIGMRQDKTAVGYC